MKAAGDGGKLAWHCPFRGAEGLESGFRADCLHPSHEMFSLSGSDAFATGCITGQCTCLGRRVVAEFNHG